MVYGRALLLNIPYASWSQHKTGLTGSGLTALRLTAMTLRRYVSENTLTDAEFHKVLRAIEEMEQALIGEKLSKHVRAVLEERLTAISRALEDYRFWGLSGIDNAYRDFAGAFLTDNEVLDAVGKSSPKGGFSRKVKEVILTLAAPMEIAAGAAILGPKTFSFIEHEVLPAPSISQPQPNSPGDHLKSHVVRVDDSSADVT